MAVKKMKLVEKDSKKNSDTDLYERTTELAYAYYLERLRNNLPGDAQSDWAAAEKQLRGKKSA